MHAVKSSIVGSILSLSIAWLPAFAGTIHLRASLDGAQVPLAVGGTGTGTMTFDTATKVLSWSVTYVGLSDACTVAHFHGPASAGVNNVPTVGMTCSASPLTGSSAALNATQEAQLLSGQWYINIHTGLHPGGEIRGQVIRVRGDMSGDGQSDLLWRNAATGENYLYPMDGLAILGTEGYLRTVADQNWKVAGIGDFDGDGRADVLWRNSSTGENYVYLMNGTAIAGEGYLRTVADQNWKVAGVGDLDGDGKADVLWRNSSSGENYLYPLDGLTIKGSEGFLRTVANQDWQVAGIGDVDGDGMADIVWRNSTTGENYLYPMSGTTILGTEGFFRMVADQNWKIVGTGDLNGDGRADLLWRNSATGENYLYPMNGTAILGSEGYVRTVPDQNWKVQATGDYDGDGKADVLWRHATSGENYLYFMDGTTIKPTEGFTRTVADQNWGVAPGVQSAPAAKLADVVIAIDTSGSMDLEVSLVQAQLNSFAAAVKAAGVDLNVVLIAGAGTLCAPASLGSGACPADENLPDYRHVPVTVSSMDAFQQMLNTHPQWSGSIRAGSQRTLIVVTDDDSDMSSAQFTAQLLALDPAFAGFRFNAIVSTLDPTEFIPVPPFLNICGQVGAAAIGTVYMNLAAQTGGIVGNLCEQDFVPFFDSFAAAIVAGFP